jgi:hypothetical protein
MQPVQEFTLNEDPRGLLEYPVTCAPPPHFRSRTACYLSPCRLVNRFGHSLLWSGHTNYWFFFPPPSNGGAKWCSILYSRCLQCLQCGYGEVLIIYIHKPSQSKATVLMLTTALSRFCTIMLIVTEHQTECHACESEACSWGSIRRRQLTGEDTSCMCRSGASFEALLSSTCRGKT